MPGTRPLNRRTVTQGSILVLPGYPALFLFLGAIMANQSDARTSGPAFDAAKAVMSWTQDPITAWACVFGGIGLVEAAALILQARVVFKWCLVVGATVAGFWAGLLLTSAFSDPLVSFTGSVWVGFGAYCHLASIRSLTRDLVFK